MEVSSEFRVLKLGGVAWYENGLRDGMDIEASSGAGRGGVRNGNSITGLRCRQGMATGIRITTVIQVCSIKQ